MSLKPIIPSLVFSVALALLTGCSHQSSPGSAAQKHKDEPPHGGTAVTLSEDFHVEFVLDKQAGMLDAYMLDGEMENFVRIAAETFEVAAKTPDREAVLVFKAVANSATGESVGSTSMFQTQADWLKNTTNFDATLKQLTVKGASFTNVAFNFPKGSDAD